MFLRIFKHLLPRAKAWNITIDKPLRQLFEGLTGLGEDLKEFVDLVWLDIFPQTTRQLDEWELQFGLPNTGLTEQERRDRLAGAWTESGGQSIKYLQDQLQAAGFDVYVHEWWVPGSEAAVNVKACATPRDPTAIAGLELMVNKITSITPDFIATFGGANIEMGEIPAQLGNYDVLRTDSLSYPIPTDSAKWPFIVYFGAATFPNKANVPASRQEELEALILKLKPAQQWAGMLINYT